MKNIKGLSIFELGLLVLLVLTTGFIIINWNFIVSRIDMYLIYAEYEGYGALFDLLAKKYTFN